MIASQQQALFADSHGSGLNAAGSTGNMGILRSTGGLDHMQLQPLLASRAIRMPGQQEPGGMRMADQMFAAKHELQLQLLRQGGAMAGLSSIGDGNGMATSNHYLAARTIMVWATFRSSPEARWLGYTCRSSSSSNSALDQETMCPFHLSMATT
jgi:hypothetical protein